MKKKIALLMAVVMLFGATVGGVLAWLTDETTVVTNTFTNNANIDIELDEADTDDSDNDGDVTDRDKANIYDLVPGTRYVKDPTVHINANSDDCYVFVKVEESNNTINNKKIIEYSIGANWVELKDADNNGTGIYIYCENSVPHIVTKGENLDNIIASNRIVINDELTETEISSLTVKDSSGNITTNNTPVLTFVAYALQAANITISTSQDAVPYWNQAFTPAITVATT